MKNITTTILVFAVLLVVSVPTLPGNKFKKLPVKNNFYNMVQKNTKYDSKYKVGKVIPGNKSKIVQTPKII